MNGGVRPSLANELLSLEPVFNIKYNNDDQTHETQHYIIRKSVTATRD